MPIVAASTVRLERSPTKGGQAVARVRVVASGETGWLVAGLAAPRFHAEGARRPARLDPASLVEVYWPPQPRANPVANPIAPISVVVQLARLAEAAQLHEVSNWLAMQDRELAAAWARSGPPEERVNPIVAEAFTGGGLYSLALHCEGAEVVEVCEFDPHAVRTLQQDLYPQARVCDAAEWTMPGGLDLATGGPPCQPWSKGGKALGPDDPRNFYPRLIDWTARARPRVFAWENSDKVVSPKQPRFRAYFEWWWGEMDRIGYEGVVWVLNAADYGSPQARKRAWLVGWPKGAPWGDMLRTPPPKTHGRPGSPAVEARELLPWTGAFDRLTSGCCAGYGLFDCKWLNNAFGRCDSCFGVMGAYPANYDPSTMTDDEEVAEHRLPYLAQLKGGRARVFSHPPAPGGVAEAFDAIPRGNRVSGWLSPALVKNMQKGVPYGLITTDKTPRATDVDRDDPAQMEAYLRTLRRMSPRTAAKLMDVPAWYEFWDKALTDDPDSTARRQAAYRQIGNGITVDMGRVVARRIFAALGFQVPVPGSPAANGDRGFWPMNTVDPCARWGGGGIPGTLPPPPKALADVDRWQRPLDGPEQWSALQAEGESMMGGFEAWGGGGGDPYDSPDYVLDEEWRPDGGPPPGFPDMDYFLQWLGGESEELIDHFERIYAEAGMDLWDQ